MTRPTQHQMIIQQLEREQARLQRLLEQSDVLMSGDVTELDEIAADLSKLEDTAKKVRERIELLADRIRDAG